MAGRQTTPEQHQQVFQLRKENKTYKEIAEKVGISVPTVGNILRAALPPELRDADALEKALQALENKFPGVIGRIQSGSIRIKIKPALISVEEI